MIVLLGVGVFVVANSLGGFARAGTAVQEAHPELFQRAGKIGVREWISFTLLWPMTVPMFPQVFSRFYIAKSARGLRTAAWLYPTVIPLLFFAPVLLGVLGHLDFPGLAGRESDRVVALLLQKHAPLWLAARASRFMCGVPGHGWPAV